MPPPLTSLLSAGATLLGVIGLIILIGRLAGRWNAHLPLRGQASGRLQTEATLFLDTKRRLHLIRCDGRRFLLLTGGSADLFLGWLPESDER